VLFPSPSRAQLEPPSTGGTVALHQELRMLGHYKRVLMIGAHPDDEDTELLAVLVRGFGAETGYLSLNRGEGGQNLIGSELGEALGLIRTEELLAARRLDGAQQYFTRAYDFGFSKSLDETWQHWPQDTILKDVVRIVRRFRPQIIVSVFSGTPRDGHGQHQAAGWAAQEAFRVAGDSTRFPELEREEHLAPWRPLKLYRSTRFDTSATTTTIDGGVLDPLIGKSFHQIAMAGRSLHRSQDMGQLQTIGPSRVRLALLQDRTGSALNTLFGGLDTTLAAMPWNPVGDAGGRRSRERFAARVDSARKAAEGSDLLAVAELLRRAEADVAGAGPDASGSGAASRLAPEQAEQLRRALRAEAIAAGVVGDATTDDGRVVPGERVVATLSVWNAGQAQQVVRPSIVPRGGWSVEDDTASGSPIESGTVRRVQATLQVPDTALPTAPYFLQRPLQGAMYDWSRSPPAARGQPFDSSTPLAVFQRNDAEWFTRELALRMNDQSRGEVRRPLLVVPRVDVKLDPASELWSTQSPAPRRFAVTLTHGARDTTTGTVGLELPAGWPGVRPQPFRLTREDERETYTFEVRPPAVMTPGSVTLRAVARDAAGQRYELGVFTVDYPHIRPRSYVRRAVAVIRSAALQLPRLVRVGYVQGAADRVPEALRDIGVPLTLLDGPALEHGDLGRYDAIVVGPRAYETDTALVEHNDRLLAFARGGGLVIVQYQQQLYFQGGFAPYPMTVGGPPLLPGGAPVGHDRVTDERAPVTVVTPGDPVVRTPNRLGAGDWEGWVQERGLYFARNWDPHYRAVLETHDPGEAPLEGGLLVAQVGRGTYVYTGLSFFRQLPAGVPGAFRLFANLLALHPQRRP
jgi:LmbE family N-acetylglucosaminyl deacetylase